MFINDLNLNQPSHFSENMLVFTGVYKKSRSFFQIPLSSDFSWQGVYLLLFFRGGGGGRWKTIHLCRDSFISHHKVVGDFIDHFKNIRQVGSNPQVGVKLKNIWNWNHHPVRIPIKQALWNAIMVASTLLHWEILLPHLETPIRRPVVAETHAFLSRSFSTQLMSPLICEVRYCTVARKSALPASNNQVASCWNHV